MQPLNPILATLIGCGSALLAAAAPVPSSPANSLDWDRTFHSAPGQRPLHFVATYRDAHGPHRLEEWRVGDERLRRLTDARIDLHADRTNTPRPGVAADYLWNVIDREKKIDHKLGSQAMFRAGMLYSFYSMAHVLSRPAGRFSLSALTLPQGKFAGQGCSWYLLSPEAQPASRICWSPGAGIPLAMESPGASPDAWQRTFEVQTLDRDPIPAATFVVDTTGLRVRNMDEMQEDD